MSVPAAAGEKFDQDVVSGPAPVPQPVEQSLGLSPSWARLQGQQRGQPFAHLRIDYAAEVLLALVDEAAPGHGSMMPEADKRDRRRRAVLAQSRREDQVMIARVTQAWRDAWTSRPLVMAITLGFVAVGIVVGLLYRHSV